VWTSFRLDRNLSDNIIAEVRKHSFAVYTMANASNINLVCGSFEQSELTSL